MKKDVRVQTWAECEQRLLQIENDNSKSLSGVWFCGHADASWPLVTTLERRTMRTYFVSDYWDLMLRIKPEVQVLTGRTWDMPGWSEPEWPFEVHFRKNSGFGYMTHLRHHGFPSPLLDWSRSPYVAAYFAFAKPEPVGDVAIYAYSEMPNNVKSSPTNDPKICSHGGYNLETHERHFRQQSAYTVCVEFDHATERWRFVSHERIFKSRDSIQDVIYRTVVPATERTNILRRFDKYNLNGYSLFGSEESLMDTLAFREIDVKEVARESET